MVIFLAMRRAPAFVAARLLAACSATGVDPTNGDAHVDGGAISTKAHQSLADEVEGDAERLLKISMPAGYVSLGPLARVNTSNCSMYLTVIRFADQPVGTAPTWQ
jgi:hypothetical protein